MGSWSNRIARLPPKEKAAGSSPAEPTKGLWRRRTARTPPKGEVEGSTPSKPSSCRCCGGTGKEPYLRCGVRFPCWACLGTGRSKPRVEAHEGR